MATMHPATLPDYVLNDIYRSAEVSVYRALKKQLPDAYHCYYSRPWLGLDRYGEEKEGEADFVIAHGGGGLLIVEVKGGRVARRPNTEQWVSTNRHRITNKIKNPVEQAKKCKYRILEKLKEQPGWKPHYITLRHGVVLPDSSSPKTDLGPDMPRYIFAFGEDMEHLGDWVDGRLQRTFDEDDRPGRGLGQDGMSALYNLLSAPFVLRPHLARAVAEDDRTIERLTDEQYHVLESLEGIQQVAISGGAGTGKTLLALQKVCLMEERGWRTLLVCYNAPLGKRFRNILSGCDPVTAGSFHSICSELAQRAGIALDEGDGSREFFDEVLPQALIDAISADDSLRFDAIVVDEGQDFRADWLAALRLALRDAQASVFYVFFDDNQKVYGDREELNSELPQASYLLTRNLRNTKAIRRTLLPWYLGRTTRATGPEGTPVDWRVVDGTQNLNSRLSTELDDLIGRQGFAPGKIAVLTARGIDDHPFGVTSRIGNHDVVRADQWDQDQIVFDSVWRFKGLDRVIVLIIDADKLTKPELIYVALSRAKALLKVFGKKSDIDRLKGSPER